jgi:hypothetical protein
MTVQAGSVGDAKPAKFKSESAFWFALKNELAKQCAMDLVKKVMSKDGHMVGGNGYPYYLRDRKWKYCIHDHLYAIRDLAKDFNKDGVVTLSVATF